MNYSAWETDVPEEITNDVLWKTTAYRLALFMSDMGWHDVTKLMKDRRTVRLSDQLYRALGSISANIAEGYSRSGGRDRARFYEYSLGSARESRDWYFKGRHILGQQVIEHRLKLLTEIIRLLIATIPRQRKRGLAEKSPDYDSQNKSNLNALLEDIPPSRLTVKYSILHTQY